jgi:diguanylate cyclase (GGDEF)-like protein
MATWIANLRAGLLWPARLLGLASVALLIGVQIYLAYAADASAREREHGVVESGVTSFADEVARKSISIALWDEAVAHLDNRLDASWADTNVGRYLSETEGFEASLVISADGRVIHAAEKGESVPAEALNALEEVARPLVKATRAAEERRGPVAAILARDHAVREPIYARAFTRMNGQLYLVAAMLVQPDFGLARPKGPRAPVIVTAERIDDAFVRDMAARFRLAGPGLQAPDATLGPDQDRVSLDDAANDPVGALYWTPPAPGAAMLAKALPATILVLLVLGACAISLSRRAARAAQSLIASEARAAHLAYHDALTGLPNRTLLGERLAMEHEQCRRTGVGFAVHCIDLDRFKEVNDTFGHAAGDELIRAAAQVLATACRKGDVLARLGGDEFAIIQPRATPESAAALADRIVAKLAEPFDLSAGRAFVGCSVGVSVVRDPASDPQETLRQADLALYRAKDGGRSRYAFFEPEMDAAVRMRRALQADLRDALLNDELEMVYQPQVDGRGRMFGVEALVRWRHAERGPVPPALFVPLAEENGLIDTLGMFTLRRAFEDSAAWDGVRVAVNLSAAQLRMRDFTSRLADLVAETRIDPERFELEITEGLLLGDDAQTHEALRRIRAMGFRIALDDFGTGYSSLSYLQRYPIDKIKIDRSFITNLGVDSDAEAVVSAIVKLARALGLSVIAEGVETETQRARLNAAGCTEVQGFLFGKPTSAQAITALLCAQASHRHPAAAE